MLYFTKSDGKVKKSIPNIRFLEPVGIIYTKTFNKNILVSKINADLT